MKHAKSLIWTALGLATSIAVGGDWLDRRQDRGKDDIVLYGNVDIREVELAFRQAGRLATLAVEEGDAVEPGQGLAELDAQPFRDALAAAEAGERQARAELEKLRRGYRPQEIAEAEQAVRQAEAALEYAAGELGRQGAVVGSGATTRHSYDLARSARDQAAAQWAAARAVWSLRKEGYRREDIAIAEAKLAGAEAAVAQARTALADTRLTAPAPAIVLARVREAGSMVNASAPVYTLSLRDPVYVRAYVDEPHLGRVVPGAEVSLQSDSSGKIYRGRIGFVSPRAEFTPKSVETTELRTDLVYRLRIVVANADPGLRQGMPVTVRVGGGAAGR
ncbi:secretion protein HlyD [Methylomagnum ishizawai]|uniref:secretion protein HlyD n=1 Tax=Methylomagnum ishizawai TaxID=1760988 RepID=UPI001C7F4C8B|nr:secretion protein HlyD [Methylomagnum ishizawai]